MSYLKRQFCATAKIRCFLLVFLAMANLARAQPPVSDAETLVRETTQTLYDALERECAAVAEHPERLFELVDEILLPHADFERMSRLVLGKYWRRVTPRQRDKFMQAFRVLLVRTYATAIQTVMPQDIRYLPPPRLDGENKAVVRTEVGGAGNVALPIHYYLLKTDSRWLLYDIRIEGVSLVANYRSSFAAEIDAKGIDALLASLASQNQRNLEARIEEMRADPSLGRCRPH